MLQGVIIGVAVFVLVAVLVYQIVSYRRAHPLLDPVEPTVSSLHEACHNWHAPPELLGSPPRSVRVETGMLGMAIMFSIIAPAAFYGMFYGVLLLKSPLRGTALTAACVTPGLILWLFVGLAYQSSRRLLQYGEITGALVTNVSNPLAGVPLDDGHGGTRYAGAAVRFAFLDQNRNLVRGWGKLPAGTQPGQVVTVVYDPAKPSRNTLYPMSGFQVTL